MVAKKGFTLIELLVVIAIIAILAAILFPVFAKAKLAAKKASSLSNIKQSSLAATLYIADYDDVLFSAISPRTSEDALAREFGSACFGTVCRFGYPILLQPYTKNTDMFICPNDTALDPSTPGRFDKKNPIYWYLQSNFPSYGMNVAYLNEPPVFGALGPDYHGRSATALDNSANTVMFAEASAKDFPIPQGTPIPAVGKFTATIGYYRVLPPSGGPNGLGGYSASNNWANNPKTSLRSQGQFYGRFDSKTVLIGWLDGHAKSFPIDRLNPGGATSDELDRYFNGRAQ